MTNHHDINYIFKEIKGHIYNINNKHHLNTNTTPYANYNRQLSKRNREKYKRNKDYSNENYMYKHQTIDNSPIRYKKQIEKSSSNLNSKTPKSKSKPKNRSNSKRINRTIDYSDINSKKNNKPKPKEVTKSPIRQRTPDIGYRNISRTNQRTPDINHMRKKSNLQMKKDNSKTKPKTLKKTNTMPKKQHPYLKNNTHSQYTSKFPLNNHKKNSKQTHNQVNKKNTPSNHHTHSNSYIKTTISTTSNNKSNSKNQIGLRKQQQYQESIPLTIPNEDTSLFQSFGKPIIHSNQKLSSVTPKEIINYPYNTNDIKQQNRNQSAQWNQYEELMNTKNQKYNSSYQLPEETNKIDFQNLDQFSPPCTLQLNYNNYSNIPSPFKTTYTNSNEDYERNAQNTINPSNNRRIINDFVKKMNTTHKRCSTIDYNYNIPNK